MTRTLALMAALALGGCAPKKAPMPAAKADPLAGPVLPQAKATTADSFMGGIVDALLTQLRDDELVPYFCDGEDRSDCKFVVAVLASRRQGAKPGEYFFDRTEAQSPVGQCMFNVADGLEADLPAELAARKAKVERGITGGVPTIEVPVRGYTGDQIDMFAKILHTGNAKADFGTPLSSPPNVIINLKAYEDGTVRVLFDMVPITTNDQPQPIVYSMDPHRRVEAFGGLPRGEHRLKVTDLCPELAADFGAKIEVERLFRQDKAPPADLLDWRQTKALCEWNQAGKGAETAWLPAGGTVHEGDCVRIKVTTTRDAHLAILSEDPDRRGEVLIPKGEATAFRMNANVAVTFGPYAILAPFGTDTLHVLLGEEPINVRGLRYQLGDRNISAVRGSRAIGENGHDQQTTTDTGIEWSAPLSEFSEEREAWVRLNYTSKPRGGG